MCWAIMRLASRWKVSSARPTTASGPCARSTWGRRLRFRMPAGERVGTDTGQIEPEHDGQAGKDEDAAARHQLVSQLSTMVRGLTRP